MGKSRLSILWTKNREGLDAVAFGERVVNSHDVLFRLQEILKDKISDARQSQLSSSSFDKPSWAYKQADLNGYQRALEEITHLIEIRE